MDVHSCGSFPTGNVVVAHSLTPFPKYPHADFPGFPVEAKIEIVFD